MNKRLPPLTPLALALALAAAAIPAGCYSHTSVEPIPGAFGGDDPNAVPIPAGMATGLKWVIDRYPPTGEPFLGRTTTEPIAISLPAGTRPDVYREVLRAIGGLGGPVDVLPVTRDTEARPIYIVGRVWMRGDVCTMDIHRPVVTLGQGPEGRQVYQVITLHMRSGSGTWQVRSHRVYPVNTIPVAPINYLDPDDLTRAVGAGRAGERLPNNLTGRPRPAAAPEPTPIDPEPATSEPAPGDAAPGEPPVGEPTPAEPGAPVEIQVRPA